jgi:hypothetical protein
MARYGCVVWHEISRAPNHGVVEVAQRHLKLLRTSSLTTAAAAAPVARHLQLELRLAPERLSRAAHRLGAAAFAARLDNQVDVL